MSAHRLRHQIQIEAILVHVSCVTGFTERPFFYGSLHGCVQQTSVQWWPTIYDAFTTLSQPWMHVLCCTEQPVILSFACFSMAAGINTDVSHFDTDPRRLPGNTGPGHYNSPES